MGSKGMINKWILYVSDKINKVAGILSGIIVMVISLIVTYEVIMRYFFRAPTIWVLEISTYLCVASVFLAGGYVLRIDAHIDVDVLTRRFSNETQVLFRLISFLLIFVYCFVLTWKGAELALTSFKYGELSPSMLGIPMFIPYAFVPLGGMLLILELICKIIISVSELKSARQGQRGTRHFVVAYLPPLILLALIVINGAMFFSNDLISIGIVVLLFVLIFARIPIGFALGVLGLMGFYLTFGGGPMLLQVPVISYKILNDFVMTAVPMFIMLSSVLSGGKIGAALFEWISTWVRHVPGGIAVASMLSCAFFGAICGSSSATVVGIGIIALPEMLKRGVPRSLAFGTIAMGGTLGALIPPSIFMILVGAITGDSVGKLFMAALLPGLFMAVIYSISIIVRAQRDKIGIRLAPATWHERWISFRKSFFGVLAPLIILGGIYSGIFTPSEAAGVGLVYSLFICFVIYRSLSLRDLLLVIMNGARLVGAIFFIIMGALVFGQVVTILQIPEKLCEFFSSLPISDMGVLYLVLFIIIILGALMDEASILLITYPIIYYIFVINYHFDSIWFALVYIVTLEVGLVAPPVGLNIFVIQSIDETAKFEEVVRGVLPFIFLMFICIIIFIYFKPFSLWLPNLIG